MQIVKTNGEIVGGAKGKAKSPVTMTGEAGTVSTVAAARIARQRRALVETFGEEAAARTDPIYPAGSRVNETGVRNFTIERRKIDSMPDGATAAYDRLKAIQRENRAETEMDLSLVGFDAKTGAVTLNGMDVDLTPTAWEHAFGLCPDAPRFAAAHAPHASLAVRAAMLNDYLPRESKQLVAAYREVGIDGRTLERPEVYRIASTKYTAFDADMVLASLLSSSADLMQTWKGDVRYDGERLALDFLSMPDQVVDLAAGDVFKIGLRLRANDVREGAITGELVAWRNRCLNLIVIGQLKHALFSLKHVGAPTEIHVALASAFAEAEVKFGAFRHDWGQARSEILLTDGMPANRFFEGLSKAKILSLPGKETEVAAGLLSAWMEEPGFTRADVVNAVTRSVHEGFRWRGAFDADAVEREAGSLLTDKNLVRKVELALAA
jgi:hypothetical protein